MKNLKLFTVLIAGVALVVLGCSKGSTGPEGPKGPAGPDSVVHSSWITLSMTGYLDNNSDTFYYEALHAPAITQRILDSGIILTYLDLPDPGTGADNLVNAALYFTEYYAVDSIYLYSLPGGFTSGIDFSGLTYRYVVVPGSVLAGNITTGPAKGLTKKDIESMSYQAIEKLFGLPKKGNSN